MAPPVLTDFQEIIVDLPDRRKLTVSRLTPLTSNDTFRVNTTANKGSTSVVGFLESPVGSTVTVTSFYIESGTDPDSAGRALEQHSVRIQNQKDNAIVVVSLHNERTQEYQEGV